MRIIFLHDGQELFTFNKSNATLWHRISFALSILFRKTIYVRMYGEAVRYEKGKEYKL